MEMQFGNVICFVISSVLLLMFFSVERTFCPACKAGIYDGKTDMVHRVTVKTSNGVMEGGNVINRWKRNKRGVNTNSSAEEDKTDSIQQTLNLLEEGTNNIRLNVYGDIVLVIGITGAGKSTMTHFIAGDNSKLFAYEADEATILIKDLHDKISTSTIVSKTIFPELIFDNETNTAYYDCPGFSDSRNTTLEIVNSFFIKKIADSAQRIKILLIVNHAALKSGGDRKDFMNLIKHANELLKDTNKFRNSIALLATKVDSSRNDNQLIRGMGTFLNSTKHELNEILSGNEHLKASQLIDILLTRDENNTYTKLTFFRQPGEPGPLSMNEEVQKRKVHIKNIIVNNTNFEPVSPSDFDHTLSHKAQNDVIKLKDALIGQVRDYFKLSGGKIKDYFVDKMMAPLPGDLAPLQKELKNLKDYSLFLNHPNSFFFVSEFHIGQGNTTSFTLFFSLVVNRLKVFNCTDPSLEKHITKRGDYLDFLELVSRRHRSENDSHRYLQRWFEPLRSDLELLNLQLQNLCFRLNSQLNDLMESISDKIEKYVTMRIEQLKQVDNFTQQIHHTIKAIEGIESVQFDKITTPSELMNVIHQRISELSKVILNDTVQLHLNQISSFLDNYWESSYDNDNSNSKQIDTTLFFPGAINPQRWLNKLKTFLLLVKPAFGQMTPRIQAKIKPIVSNLTEWSERYFKFRIQGYQSAKELRVKVKKDLRDYILFVNLVKNYSSAENQVSDTDFLRTVFTKLSRRLDANFYRTINDLINEQIGNLLIVRKFSSDLQVSAKTRGKEYIEVWLTDFMNLYISVAKQFSKYFEDLNTKMESLMTYASLQTVKLFCQKFEQLSAMSLNVNELKKGIIQLMTIMQEIQDLNPDVLVGLTPSDFLLNVSYPLTKLDSELSFLGTTLFDELGDTAYLLNQLDSLNLNINMETSVVIKPAYTTQAIWLDNWKSSVQGIQSNFTVVSDEIQSMIKFFLANLTLPISRFYTEKFSNLAVSEDKMAIINFKDSIQQDLDILQGTYSGADNMAKENMHVALILDKTTKNLTKLAKSNSVRTTDMSQQLRDLGDCLDIANSFMNLKLIPSEWLHSFRKYISTLSEIINSPPRCNSIIQSNRTLTVYEGTFVNIRQILYPNSPLSSCITNASETLIIISLHTVFIDESLIGRDIQPRIDKSLNIAIIAPHWVIKGKPTIDLSGRQGCCFSTNKAGQNEYGDGLPGLRGHPGGDAGNFLGLGMTLNYKNGVDNDPDSIVHILARGGNGGRGQNGGDGLSGADGKNVTVEEIEFNLEENGDSQIAVETNEMFSVIRESHEPCGSILSLSSCIQCKIQGASGSVGRNGGNGGMGGTGGKGGVITLLGPLHFSRFFNISQSSTGEIGHSGQPGKGGSGGNHGYLATVQIKPGVDGKDGFKNGKKVITQSYQGKAKNGRSGRRGVNDYSAEATNTNANKYSLGDHFSALNLFRNYARKNIANSITKSSLPRFLHKLDMEDIYRKNLPIVTDVDEFLDLDSQYFHENSEDREFLEFYTNYTRKIVRILNLSKTSEADKNALKYLYSASLSRIIRVKEKHFESILISDMTSYLSHLQKNVESLREQPAIYNALSLITNGTKDHTNQTEMYCWSTFDFAFKEVYSDLVQYKNDLDTSIEQLLTEIRQLKNLNNSTTLLANKRENLKTKFFEVNAYTLLKIGSRFLNFFGPLTVAVKSGVLIGAKALGLSHEEIIKVQTKTYMEMQKRISLKMCRYNLNQLNAFAEFLNYCKEKLGELEIKEILLVKFDQAISETEKKIQEGKMQIIILESQNTTDAHLKSVSTSIAPNFIRFTKVRLRLALASTRRLIINDRTKWSQISVDVDRIQEIINSLLISPELYLNIRNDTSKVEEVITVRIETEKKTEELERFSLWVEQELSSIRDEFSKQMGFDAVGESVTYQTGLDELTSIWNISKKLKDGRMAIRNQFEFYNKSNPEITLRYEKLDEGFTMLIRVYEITVNFYRKSKLGNVIAKINSVALESTRGWTEDVKNKVQCVELVIVSNMFMGQYHMILNSLKMAVFPFAQFYVKNVAMPDKLVVQYAVEEGKCKLANSTVLIQDMAQAALKVIKIIRAEVRRYKNNVDEKSSKYLKVGVFDNSEISKPFYIWEYHSYKFAIQKLLSGEIVVLKADILKCPHIYDAVKLLTLDVKFATGKINNNSAADNELMLNELAKVLIHFRVVMTHLGNSVYRYDGKYYTITSQPIIFEFSFQKDLNGVPKYKNKEYDMMISGDILISPYAMWKIQLIPLDTSRDFVVLSNFNKFEKCQFDLQLHGKGSYVTQGLSNIFKMNEFYKVDKTVGVDSSKSFDLKAIFRNFN